MSFGGLPATDVTVTRDSRIVATTPAHAAGAADVLVTNPDGQSGALAGGYTYVAPPPAPTVTSVDPTDGPTAGGTAVTITGTGLVSGATVSFGGLPATVVSVQGDSGIVATTPAHVAGAVDVLVTNPDGQSGTLASGYTYVSPPPPPTSPRAGLVVYDDSLVNQFTFNEWQSPSGTPCLVDESYTDEKVSGAASLAANLNYHCTLFLHRDERFGADQYTEIELDVYRVSPAPTRFELRIATNSYSSTSSAVKISTYATVTDIWQRVTIPLADFGVSPGAMIAGIRFRGGSAVGRGEVLFDNIRFVESSVSPSPARP